MRFDDGADLETLVNQREAQRELGNQTELAQCDAALRAAAAEQGLAEDELAEIEVHVLKERRHASSGAVLGQVPFEGQYRIVGYGRWILLIITLQLAVIMTVMGAPLLGIGLVVIAACAGFGPRRVRRFVVDGTGELHLGSRAAPALDWQCVRSMRLQRIEPWWTTGRFTKMASAQLDIVLEMIDGQKTCFGRGMYFQVSPKRVPVHLDDARRYFKAECKRRGMSVEPIPDGFVAERRPPF